MNIIGFLTSRLGLAVIGAVVALGAIVWVYEEGKDAGHVDDLKATTETQRRIDDADAHGPRTPDDVDKRLRDGRF
jgi:hypothetical protein